MNIFGIDIVETKKDKILQNIETYLIQKKPEKRGWTLSSVGPELLLLTKKDLHFRKLLQKTTIVFPEGSGMSYAGLFLLGKWIPKVPGVDLVRDLLRIASEHHKKVLCVLAEGGLSSEEDVKNILQKQFPHLKIFTCSVFSDHPMIEPERRGKMHTSSEKISQIFETVKPDMVFVALGQGIQEKWIAEYQNKFDDVSIWMGVGGSFDFFTGKVCRAPKILRILGLEWLWRLFLSPRKRLKRIFNAVIIFPMLVFSQKYGIIF